MNKKICLIGNAGSGKSTLSAELFVTMKKLNSNVELVFEWVRGDIQTNGPMSDIWEQYRICNNQRAIEDAIPDNVEYSIIDSGTLTAYFYAVLYSDNTKARHRLVMQDMYKSFLDDLYLRRYDYILFLPNTETYKANSEILDDGTRYQTQEQINILEEHMNLMFTKLHKLDNVHVLSGPLSTRCEQAMAIILGDQNA